MCGMIILTVNSYTHQYTRLSSSTPLCLPQVTDAESQELGEQVVVMMMPISDTCVRLMTHCNVKKDDVKSVIKKLQYIIQEYDNMMYLEYKISE